MTQMIGDAPGDFAAWHKLITGAWIYNVVTGEVISRSTNKPLVFLSDRKNASVRTNVHGHMFTVKKDRIAKVAVWIGRCEGHILIGGNT